MALRVLAWAFLCSLLIGCSSSPSWDSLVGRELRKHSEFAYVVNDPALPNVLIYGDSISVFYTGRVRDDLAGRANVYRLHCNGKDSGKFIHNMTRMHEVMRNGAETERWDFEWDVIHFNVGLHDLKYTRNGVLDLEWGKQVNSVVVYQRNLREIIIYLKRLAPQASLIFATTTPVPRGAPGRVEGDVMRYNVAALKVLRDFPEIEVNDLYAFTLPNVSKWKLGADDVHYGELGRKAQGDEVSRVIGEVLDRR